LSGEEADRSEDNESDKAKAEEVAERLAKATLYSRPSLSVAPLRLRLRCRRIWHSRPARSNVRRIESEKARVGAKKSEEVDAFRERGVVLTLHRSEDDNADTQLCGNRFKAEPARFARGAEPLPYARRSAL
jgi:hypothetical protein